MELIPYTVRSTGERYSPHDLLPAPIPMQSAYYPRHFYQTVVKHLVRDTVRIMMNGLHIDMEKVAELEKVLDEQLIKVADSLASNSKVQEYLDKRYSSQLSEYKLDKQSKLRDATYYLKEFNPKDMVHRSYFMKLFAAEQDISPPTEEVLPGVPKWPVKLVRKLSTTRPVLTRLLNGELSQSNKLVKQCMQELAEYRAALYNKSYKAQIASPEVDRPVFNPASSLQKQELFELLGIESEATTASGAPQWDRSQVERVGRETDDPVVKGITEAFIDHSYAAIVRNNFIEGFYNYSIGGRLYGTYRLLGAKTARFTSSRPNMLNMPSTNSVFSKAIKECFTAPKGKVILTADYNGLEDRVLASLTNDEGKCAILEDTTLDGHCYNALGYYPDEVRKYLTFGGSYKDEVREFASLVESGHPELKELRQRSKCVTFKLAYLGMADADRGGVITQQIYDNYHYVLYSGVRAYIDNYVTPTACANGSIHAGLGFSIFTDDAKQDQKTLHNCTVQFWSVLSVLSINKMHQLIDEEGLAEDVKIVSSIYDSIYIEVTMDPAIVAWVNNNLIDCMVVDFIPDQRIPSTAESELGLNWSDLTPIPNGASVEYIASVLETIKDTTC